jgi:hypothetical protein
VSAPVYLLDLHWAGQRWRRCTGAEAQTLTRPDGRVDSYAPGLEEPGVEEVVDLLQQVPDGVTAALEVDLGTDSAGVGWPVHLVRGGHLPYRARGSLYLVRTGEAPRALIVEGEVETLAYAAPDQAPGWVALRLVGRPRLDGTATLRDPTLGIVQEDALTPPAADYTYEATGQRLPVVWGLPGSETRPGWTAHPAEVILGLDVQRLLVAVAGYSGTVRVWDGAGTYEDLPAEQWTDAAADTWTTVDVSGSTTLDLQSSSWSCTLLAGARTEPHRYSGGQIDTLGAAVTWCLRRCGVVPAPLGAPAWAGLPVAWVVEEPSSAEALLRDVLLPSWPLALATDGGQVRLVELVPSRWPARVGQQLSVSAGHLEPRGPVQLVRRAEELASALDVTWGLDSEGQPLGQLAVELPGGALLLDQERRQARSYPALTSESAAQAAAQAWGEVAYRPWWAREYLVLPGARCPRAGDVVQLEDPAQPGGVALVSIVRLSAQGDSVTLLLPG